MIHSLCCSVIIILKSAAFPLVFSYKVPSVPAIVYNKVTFFLSLQWWLFDGYLPSLYQTVMLTKLPHPPPIPSFFCENATWQHSRMKSQGSWSLFLHNKLLMFIHNVRHVTHKCIQIWNGTIIWRNIFFSHTRTSPQTSIIVWVCISSVLIPQKPVSMNCHLLNFMTQN